MTDRQPLTADEAREYAETGRVEIWTRIEPQPEKRPIYREDGWIVTSLGDDGNLQLDRIIRHPHGPDGDVWIGEDFYHIEWDEWESEAKAYRNLSAVIPASQIEDFLDAFNDDQYELHPAREMTKDQSRFPANNHRTTTAEQKPDGWWLLTVIERR
jgi:hypothetical protein